MAFREKMIDPNKVAIYIRWSTDDQSDGTTLEVQLDGCRHYLLSQGWVVNEDLLFVDDGWSGGSLDRPALKRLRGMVTQGLIDCVVVFKLDRLSRSVIDMVNLVLEEWDGLTHVKSAREPLDTSSAMGKQFFYMLVSFAEWERNVIRERTSAGRLARAKEGYKPSAKAPYGYRHGEKKGSYEVEPLEAPVVQRIFELYTRGSGAKAIVTRLNSEGIRFRDGALWNERTLLYLLSNPTYTGKMVYGRMSKNPRRGKASGETFWVKNETVTVVENSSYIPALVGEDLFALAQQIKAGRRVRAGGTSPAATASEHLLTGLAKCNCGYSLYAKSQRNAKGVTYWYYACTGKKIKGKEFCDSPNVPMAELDRQVSSAVVARYGDVVSRERFRQALLADIEAEEREVLAGAQQLDQRLAQVEAEERQVRLDYRERAITAAQFSALSKDLTAEALGLRTQRQQLATRGANLVERRRSLSALFQAIGQMDQWGALSPPEQKGLLRCFLDSVTVAMEPKGKVVNLHISWH